MNTSSTSDGMPVKVSGLLLLCSGFTSGNWKHPLVSDAELNVHRITYWQGIWTEASPSLSIRLLAAPAEPGSLTI